MVFRISITRQEMRLPGRRHDDLHTLYLKKCVILLKVRFLEKRSGNHVDEELYKVISEAEKTGEVFEKKEKGELL